MTWQRLRLVLVFGLAVAIFTFRLTGVPPGIETDEGAIAHNAALIAKTGRDQNGRFLPVFVLSADKVDWKQPVVVYAAAAFFKVFGASLLTFKMVNVAVATVAMIVLWQLLKSMFDNWLVIFGLLVFATTPIVVISSRIGTETIYPVLFSGIWLLALLKNKPIVAGAALGLSFYCYKSMRLIIPPWAILSVLFLFKRNAKQVALFVLALLPFLAITPILEQKYAGAIFDRRQVSVESYRHYAYYWLSNLNPALLFVQGDAGQIFAVEKFGMFLLGSLPFFLLGVKKATEDRSFLLLVLAAFVTAPVLFGLAGSDQYGHRLTAVVPMFAILVTVGIKEVKSPLVKWLLGFLIVLNGVDFLTYYFFKYPSLHSTQTAFSNNLNRSFYKLSKIGGREYFVQDDLFEHHGEGNQFFEAAYFDKPISKWKRGELLPSNGVLLTELATIDGARDSGVNVSPLFILEASGK